MKQLLPLLKKAFIVFFLLSSATIWAQPGCPAVSAGHYVQLPCGTSCATLTATPFQVGSTTSYSMSQIPFTPFVYTGGTAVSLPYDDEWGTVINLPFNFCFFGNVYNQAVVGANGIVTFNTYRATQYNPWSLTACVPVPSTNPVDSAFTNCIMCPYQDIDPALGGSIQYQIMGSAPCRILVVSYYQVPMYNTSYCSGNNCTCQMAIYETTNAIEIYIANKQYCSSWNGGLSYEGITDNTGTVAYTIPGRNLTQWSATNDAWRFTPNGPSIVSVSWYNGATQISTDSTAHVCPGSTTTYTAQAVYLPCAGGTPVTVTDTVTVALTGSLNAGIDSVDNISCAGLQDGKIFAHVSGGTAPVTYGWADGGNALSRTNLAAGTYVFTASDAGNCTRSETIVITQPSLIGISGTVTNPLCSGSCNGSVATTDTGGTGGPYTYHWNTTPVQTTATASNLCAGPVNVTVTDAHSCSSTATFTLTNPASLTINQLALVNPACGVSNGSITVGGSGGTGAYTYNWSNNQTGAQDTALAAGAYTVTVTDTAGCTATATFILQQPNNGLGFGPATINNIQCYGNSTGAIIANATGGNAPLSYSWTEAGNGTTYNGQAINNLQADVYHLTVTDAGGCTDTISYTVTSPTALNVDSFAVVQAICGQANGSASVYISGGTQPYSYNWTNYPGVNSNTINNIPGGNYTVTVTDGNNCTIQQSMLVPQTTQVVITLAAITPLTCYQSRDGAVSINVSGGTAPYTINWSNNATDSLSITNLAAGTYTVTVSDATGCPAIASYNVTQPTQLIINPPALQNVGCAGGSTGSITANVSGSVPQYNYSWVEQSNNQAYSTQTINNLAPDIYNLTVTDQHNCSATATYAITAVPPLVYTVDSTNVTCYGGSNGSVTVAISSGRPPYLYVFNNTGSTGGDSTYSNLSTGLVDVIVIDADNCRGHNIINIQQPTQLVIQTSYTQNNFCHGDNTGAIGVNVSGGTPGYRYSWSNYAATPYDSNLIAGNYSLTVTDTVGCTATKSFQLTQPTAVTASPVVINALCYGSSDGSINANPSGGTPGYGFSWSNGSTAQTATNLATGSYTCTITDANGCSITTSGTISQPTQITVTFDTATAPKCPGQKTGTAFIEITGGSAPYSYAATKDGANFIHSTNGVLLGLDTGTYTIIIADNVGCPVQTSITVPNATPDSFALVVDSALCYGYSDGAGQVIPLPPSSQLNGPFKFGINGIPAQTIGEDTGYFQNLAAGHYLVTAVNTNGCVDSIPFTVYQPDPITVTISPDTVTLPLGGSQQMFVTTNAVNATYNWGPSNGLSCVDCPDPVVSAYTTGDYIVTVSTVNDTATCFATATLHVTVGQHSRAFAPNAFTPNGDGNNDKFEIYGEAIKTLSLKIFNRWGELVFQSTNSLAGWDGTYKGVLQYSGVYTYVVTITYLDDSQEFKKGTLTLIR